MQIYHYLGGVRHMYWDHAKYGNQVRCPVAWRSTPSTHPPVLARATCSAPVVRLAAGSLLSCAP